MRAVLTLARKDLRLLLRDRAGMFFTLLFPILFATFFGVLFSGAGGGEGGGSSIAVVLVDQDGSEASRRLAASLAGSDGLTVEKASDPARAEDLVRRGKKTAYILIPAGYGEAAGTLLFQEPPHLIVGIDPSRRASRGMLQGILLEHSFQWMQEMFTRPEAARERVAATLRALDSSGMDPETGGLLRTFFQALDAMLQGMPEAGSPSQEAGSEEGGGGGGGGGWAPVRIEMRDVSRPRAASLGPRNPFEITFPQGIIWGIMACAAGFGISLVSERVRGTFLRLRMAPIERRDLLAGKALACFVTIVIVALLLLGVGMAVFRVRPDSIPLFLVALVATAVCFVGIMMLLAVLGRSEASAGGIGWGVLTILAMIGGGMIPVFAMPPWLLSLSHLSPVKWSILAMEGAIWRGFTPRGMLLPCGILAGVGVLAFTIGMALFRRLDA